MCESCGTCMSKFTDNGFDHGSYSSCFSLPVASTDEGLVGRSLLCSLSCSRGDWDPLWRSGSTGLAVRGGELAGDWGRGTEREGVTH